MAGFATQVLVLAVLHLAVGLKGVGWVAGLACGVAVAGLLSVGLARRHRAPGPADVVTLGRSTLVGGVAALVASDAAPAVLVAMAAVALCLDGVDGRVARRTGTASDLGARFDMEVDALLVLLLSWQVATATDHPWVLLIGSARYLKGLAAIVWPWWGRTAPPRSWAKTVAVVQGVVLTVTAAEVLPRPVTTAALVLAALLLAESFATEARWLWRHRPATTPHPARERLLTAAALVLVSVALAAPHTLEELRPLALVRLPVEAVVFLGVVLVLPRRLDRVRGLVAWVAGVALGALALLKVLDLGFRAALNRPFDPLVDWAYTDELVALVRDSTGELLGTALLAAGALVAVVLVAGPPLAVRRLTRAIDQHRAGSRRLLATLVVLWVALAVVGARGDTRPPLAAASTATYAYHQVARVPSELRSRAEFERATRDDPWAATADRTVLAGLRGKDVLVVFVESYGRVALTDPALADGVGGVLDAGTTRLGAAGFTSTSAYLTSPTFGALSWLAHATLQTGLWVDSQDRYDLLVRSPRLSLTRLFAAAGWRTVASVPANTEDWPEAAFFGFDHVYDSRNVGYRGPRFGYPTMPDQFTLQAFWRLELAERDRRPVMAEIDLVSSHAPWSRTPRMVDRAVVGDGSVFVGMPDQLPSEPEIWTSPERIRRAYGDAVEYSLQCVVDFVADHGHDDLVVVVVGDHQPATVVSGTAAGHDVPVTVIARDPEVLDRIDSWGWGQGLRPDSDAPVVRMDEFRDAFLDAYAAGDEHTGVAPTTG